MNDQLIAQGAMLANQQLTRVLQGVAPLFKQAEEVIQKKMPPPQMPPEVTASIQIAKAETDRKAQFDKATFDMKAQEANVKKQQEDQQTQFNNAMEAATMQREQQKADFNEQLQMFKAQAAKANDELTQQVEMMKNDADNRQHQMTELMKNADDNRTALEIKLKEVQGQVAQQASNPPVTIDIGNQLKEMHNDLLSANDKKIAESINPVMEVLKTLAEGITAPKRLVRDASGKAIGVEHVKAGDK